MKNSVLCILYFMFFLSCTKGNKKDFLVNFETDERLKLSLIADSVSFFEVEENDSCLIGSTILNLCIDNGEMYIFDKKTLSIFRYTLDGKLINKISRRGLGPGEYQNIDDFYVKDSIVYIKQYINIYQYTLNGDFIKKDIIKDPQFIEDFVVSPSYYLAYYKADKYSFKEGVYLVSAIDQEAKPIVTPVRTYNFYTRQIYHFCKLSNNFYGFVDYLNGNIYHLNQDTAYVAYTFSVSKKNSAELLYTYNKDVKKNTYYNYYMHYIENDMFLLLFVYERKNKFYTTFYNKQTKQAMTGKSQTGENYFIDDLGNAQWIDTPYYSDNKLYVMIENPDSENRRFEVIYLKQH